MSIIKQSLLELKKAETEARKLAEQQLIKEGKSKLDEIVSKLMEDIESDEDDSQEGDGVTDAESTTPSLETPETSTVPEVEPVVGDTDTRDVGGEFSDFLGDELGSDKPNEEKPIEIEVTVDTNPDKEEKQITPVIKTDEPVEASPVVNDATEEDDIEKVMEMFNELMDNDDVVVLKDKQIDGLEGGLDDIMSETQISEPTDTIYKEKSEPEMEIKDQEIVDNLDSAKKLSENEIESEPETSEIELNEEDIMKMMEGFTEEEMAEITKEALEELWSPNSDETEVDYDGLDKSGEQSEPIAEVLEVAEEINLEGLPDEIKNLVKTMQNMNFDDETINMAIEKYRTQNLQQEGMSGSVSHANARHAGDSDTSYTKIENSRLDEQKLKTINEGFDKVSKLAKKLESDNTELKSKISSLNESKLKLEETVSKYESEMLKYKEKFYEVVLEATKASSVNKLLLENSTTAVEKRRIVETFQNLKTRAEVTNAFNQLNESFKADGSSVLNESRTLDEIGSKTTKVYSTGTAKIVESTIRQLENPELAKMIKNINYGKKEKNN